MPAQTTSADGEKPKIGHDRYRTLAHMNYDLVIIGGGSAGLSAASLAVAIGAKVALLDRERLGGECLYTGCVPSKALLHVAHQAAHIRAANAVGLDAHLEPVNLGQVNDYAQRAIQTIQSQTDNPEHYTQMGVDVALGDVRFVASDVITINGQRVRARRFLIATGSHASVPPIEGLAAAGYQTNETIFSLRKLPQRLAVIGGGPVGCELGQAFDRLGSEVTILQRPDRLLPRDEPDASALLRSQFAGEGITVETQARVLSVERRDECLMVRFDSTTGPREIAVDEILVAAGRSPNVTGLDLETAGVDCDVRNGITVDRYLRTSNRRIYAAGDVIGGYQFTHAAALQARTAVRNALFPGRTAYDDQVIPWATFTEPEVAHVGLSAAQARQRYGDMVGVFVQQFREVDRAVTDSAAIGFVKLISAKNGTLLGAQIVGNGAGEQINELALALRHHLRLGDLAKTTHVYPTLSLAIQQTAGEYTTGTLRRSRVIRLLNRLRAFT